MLISCALLQEEMCEGRESLGEKKVPCLQTRRRTGGQVTPLYFLAALPILSASLSNLGRGGAWLRAASRNQFRQGFLRQAGYHLLHAHVGWATCHPPGQVVVPQWTALKCRVVGWLTHAHCPPHAVRHSTPRLPLFALLLLCHAGPPPLAAGVGVGGALLHHDQIRRPVWQRLADPPTPATHNQHVREVIPATTYCHPLSPASMYMGYLCDTRYCGETERIPQRARERQ